MATVRMVVLGVPMLKLLCSLFIAIPTYIVSYAYIATYIYLLCLYVHTYTAMPIPI